MAEYIKREAFLRALENADPDVYEDYGDGTVDWGFGRKNIQDMITGIPAADVAPVVNGRWIEGSLIITCSECKRGYNLIAKYTHYCPNCGAKMDGDAE